MYMQDKLLRARGIILMIGLGIVAAIAACELVAR